MCVLGFPCIIWYALILVENEFWPKKLFKFWIFFGNVFNFLKKYSTESKVKGLIGIIMLFKIFFAQLV